MHNVFVFRINYDENFKRIRSEILSGRLRQGWGADGMSIDSSLDDFISAWKKKWGENDADLDTMKRKYDNLCIMKEIKEGDILVIPKLDISEGKDYPCRCFTVVECTNPYCFSVLNDKADFGHIIGIKVLFSCSYHGDRYDTLVVSGKFKAYQKALNRVNNSQFIKAVDRLIDVNRKTLLTTEIEPCDFTFIMAQELSEKYDRLVEDNLTNLRNMDPKSFEYLIKELFEKNGFTFSRMNSYDGEGGDIDVQMMLNEKSLFGAVFKQAKGVDNFYINIQAKKKTGKDWNAKTAVEQLVKKRTAEMLYHVDIVIDLTDDFDEETEKYAHDNHVVLINGKQCSLLLLQFGLTSEIDI